MGPIGVALLEQGLVANSYVRRSIWEEKRDNNAIIALLSHYYLYNTIVRILGWSPVPFAFQVKTWLEPGACLLIANPRHTLLLAHRLAAFLRNPELREPAAEALRF